MKDFKFVGNIEVADKVMISDPCYLFDPFNNIMLSAISGTYNCYLKVDGNGRNEVMVAILGKKDNGKNHLFEHCGYVGVDSGTMSISDGAYYEQYHDDELNEEWYVREVCENTCLNDGIEFNIADGKCFISPTCYGDGTYKVTALFDKNDYAYGFKVEFI